MSASCPHETEVSTAVRTDEWHESIANHVADCALCREIVQASHWMQALAQSPTKSPSLGDAEQLWRRAQLAERPAKARKNQGFLEWLEVLSGTVVPLSLVAWVAWNWYEIQGQVTALLIGWWPQLSAGAYSFSGLAPALLILAAMSSVYPLFTRYC